MTEHNQRLYKEGEARYRRFLRQRSKGMTLKAIAEIEGCTKQRVSQILKRYAPAEAKAARA